MSISDSDQIDPLNGAETPENASPHDPGKKLESSIADEATVIGDESPSRSPAVRLDAASIDGYEVVEELGRGGMGVVYRARDLKLDRTVALKMIIGGKFASSDDIQRFRIEAESAARLDHAGIVPIYDIGEAGGNHFFSMKLIDGGPLSDDGERFQTDARAAAELIIKVAEAVQHAHERGVLHRDLKPANILIDETGNPLITDLGLAKRMDNESGLTQTGLAMGTPGFMAPEQAQGRKDITTAADVFSLGAILYWLQTGEAPFRGDNAVEALMATLESEIPSLRSINQHADADLDLICQRAMHRDPSQRYASAAAMSNDLRAWLNGELLSVRAPTALGLASVWIRKNLRTVLGAGITGIICGLVVGWFCIMQGLRDAAQHEYELTQLGHNHPSWVAGFAGIREMSDAWLALQFLIVPAVALCALLNVLLVRPKSREANTVAAVTAALAAGAAALLIGVGWQPMRKASLERGSQDIEVLANAVWLESDLERELAQQSLIQRYPGLAEMDQKSRQKMLFRKIEHDQDVGILPGIWWGIGFGLLFVMLPMLMTSILSGALWLRGIQGWPWFGLTLERSAYCVIFFTVIALQLMPIPPGLILTLVTMVVMATALFFAVRDARSIWRISFGLTPTICMFMLNMDMAQLRGAASAAGLAATDDELGQRAAQIDRLVSHTHEPYLHYGAGIAWLSIGDEQRYQQHCHELLSDFENAFRPEIASRLAKLSLLRPDLQSPDNLELFHKLARFAASYESSELKHWFFLTRAISEQRQGNFAAAFEWNRRTRDVKEGNGYMLAATHAVDALAHLDASNPAGARNSLVEGQKLRDKTRGQSFRDGHDVGWIDWRVFQIFEDEINARLAAVHTDQLTDSANH